MAPHLKLIEGGRRWPKRLMPSQSLALGALWARRPERHAYVGAVSALVQNRNIDLGALLEAVQMRDVGEFARDVRIPVAFIDWRFVYHFVGGVHVVATESCGPRAGWRPNSWTLASLRDLGCIPSSRLTRSTNC